MVRFSQSKPATILLMLNSIAIIIVLVMLGAVIWAPHGSVLIYGATAGYADGFAVLMLLEAIPWYQLTMNILLVAALGRAVLAYLGDSKRELPFRGLAFSALFGMGFVVVSRLVQGLDIFQSLSYLPYLGFPFLVIWMAFAGKKAHLTVATSFLLLQMLVAVAVLLIPAMSVLDGRHASGAGLAREAGPLALPTELTNKGLRSAYGQFHNPNALGFYSGMSMATGLALFRSRKVALKIVALALLVAGVFGWLNSLTRGPVIGILAGLGIWWFLAAAKENSSEGKNAQTRVRLLIATASVALSAGILVKTGLGGFLLPHRDNVSVRGRLEGLSNGWAAVQAHPYMGVDTTWAWSGTPPHILPLAFAAQYGIVVGILSVVILFGYGGRAMLRALRCRSLGESATQRRLVAVLWGPALIGIALTDNLTAPVLFWVSFAEVLLLFPSVKMTPRVNKSQQGRRLGSSLT